MSILLVIILIVIGGIIAFVSKKLKINSKKKEEPQKGYIVLDKNGIEIKILFIDRRTDYTGKPPFYGKDYNLFVDERGNYWRSYDNDRSFLSAEEYNRRNM